MIDMQAENGDKLRETSQKVDALQAQLAQLVIIQKFTFLFMIFIVLYIAISKFGLGSDLNGIFHWLTRNCYFNPFDYVPSISVSLNYPAKSDENITDMDGL